MKGKLLLCIAWMNVILMCSCAHYKDIPYFQNSETFSGEGKEFLYDMTIKPKDQLTIFVFSGSDKETVALFNMRVPREMDLETRMIPLYAKRIHHYLVDNDGNIVFPLLGKVKVGGLTIPQANDYLKKLIQPYLKKDADFIVNTLIDNYNISVLGEVKNPNTFTISRPQITVLEALAMAGDMTIYGKRDNVKILRELSDGTYEVHELDMRDANILNSPYYYLEQRDIVYVEPNKTWPKTQRLVAQRSYGFVARA